MGLLAMAGMVSGLGEGIRETGKTAQAGYIQSALQDNYNAFQLKKQQEQQAYDTTRVDREQSGANERQRLQGQATIDAATIAHPDRRNEEAVSNALKALQGMSEQWHKQMDAKALFNIQPTQEELDRITKIETMRDTILGHTGNTAQQIMDLSHFNDKKAPSAVDDPYKKGGRGAAPGAAEQKMESDNTGNVLEKLFAPRRIPTEAPRTKEEEKEFLRNARAAAAEEGMELSPSAMAKLAPIATPEPPPVKRLAPLLGARRGSAILPPDPAVSLESTPPAALPSRENETTRKMQELRDAGGKGLPSGVELIVPAPPATVEQTTPPVVDPVPSGLIDSVPPTLEAQPAAVPHITLSRTLEARFQQQYPDLANQYGWEKNPDDNKGFDARNLWNIQRLDKLAAAAPKSPPTPTLEGKDSTKVPANPSASPLTPWVGAAKRLGETTENENTQATDLRRFEGLELTPYRDQGNGWAIGYGTQLPKNLSAAERGTLSITAEDAKAYAIMDLRRQRAELVNYGWFNALSTEKQNGIAQLAYTMGVDGVLKFHKMIKALEAGDDAKVAAEIRNSDWYKQVKPTRGEFVIRQLQGN